MTPRTAALVAVLAAAGIAISGCGGGSDPASAAPTSPTLPTGSLNSPGASIAPSGTAAKAPTPGESGDDKGGSNGGGENGSGGGSTPPTLPTPAGNTGLGSLPAGFPLPQGTTLGRIAVRATDITAPMLVPDGDRAAAFWKTQLPTAGYKVSSAKVSRAFGDIKFSGNGCVVGSDIAISGEHVAFLCKRR
jgi:hypothetical protein